MATFLDEDAGHIRRYAKADIDSPPGLQHLSDTPGNHFADTEFRHLEAIQRPYELTGDGGIIGRFRV